MNDGISKRFVVGIDDSDHARRALRWAVAEASDWNAQLDVVHAWNWPFAAAPPLDVAHPARPDVLERAANDFVEAEVAATIGARRSQTRVDTITPRGSAGAALIEIAKGADLLVVGTRGRNFVRGALLGSVSNRCLHHATCPVAIIRGDTDATTDPKRRSRVLVGVDSSEYSYDALKWALAESAQRSLQLTVVIAWSWLDHPGDPNPHFGAEDARAIAEALVDKALGETPDAAGVDVKVQPFDEHPSTALVDASAQAGLLVVGHRGLGGFDGLRLGSVSDRCVHAAHCPVIVIRRDEGGGR
jgi:nucleotide-binding universal stress UspA family protein